MTTTLDFTAFIKGMESFNNVTKGEYRTCLIVAPNLFAPFDMQYSFSIDKVKGTGGDMTEERVYTDYHMEESGCANALAMMLSIIEGLKNEKGAEG